MGILLSCQNLSKSFGARPLFEGLSFGLFEGERTGLIGPNGAGKSTLLKILAGEDKPDGGLISPRKGPARGLPGPAGALRRAGDGLTVRAALTQGLEGLGLEDYEIDIRMDAGWKKPASPTPNRRSPNFPAAGASAWPS